MLALKLTSPNGSPVVIVVGAASSLMITPNPIKPEGEFIVGTTQMIPGSRIFNGQQNAVVIESVERIFELLTVKQPDGYQIASDQ